MILVFTRFCQQYLKFTCMQYLGFLQKLLRKQSITPNDDGTISIIKDRLETHGFSSLIESFWDEVYQADVNNLYAKLGSRRTGNGPNLCFAGHVDVVPPGNELSWKYPPFSGTLDAGTIYGRGVADMKGAIVAFIAAVEEFLEENPNWATSNNGSISFLITADEEGRGINGVAKMLPKLQKMGEIIDACIVGEPVSFRTVGDTIKIGARGSASFILDVFGKQGHVGYNTIADNAGTKLIQAMQRLREHKFDSGNKFFPETNLEVTLIQVDSGAENVIPGTAQARFNVRFNNLHTAQSIAEQIKAILDSVLGEKDFELHYHSSGEAFLNDVGWLVEKTQKAIYKASQIHAKVDTLGGTSDARFINKYCSEVIEVGLLHDQAHVVNECSKVQDIEMLVRIYKTILTEIFLG